MQELAANDTIIKGYLTDIQHLKSQDVEHELGLKAPFHNLLDKAGKRRGWTLVAELSTYSGGKRVVPDGTVRDEFRLARGWWEAKDTSDKLAAEILWRKKGPSESKTEAIQPIIATPSFAHVTRCSAVTGFTGAPASSSNMKKPTTPSLAPPLELSTRSFASPWSMSCLGTSGVKFTGMSFSRFTME